MACSAQDLKEVMKKLLLAFYSANRHHKPERLIFYRDGVSEGQARFVSDPAGIRGTGRGH